MYLKSCTFSPSCTINKLHNISNELKATICLGESKVTINGEMPVLVCHLSLLHPPLFTSSSNFFFMPNRFQLCHHLPMGFFRLPDHDHQRHRHPKLLPNSPESLRHRPRSPPQPNLNFLVPKPPILHFLPFRFPIPSLFNLHHTDLLHLPHLHH